MSDDQDFFFDEDEQPVETAERETSRAKSPSRPTPRPSSLGSAGAANVTMTVAALIGVVALLVGVIIGILLPVGASSSNMTSPAGVQTAPQLSPDALEGGELPEGHPDITDMNGGAMPGAEETGTVEGEVPAE